MAPLLILLYCIIVILFHIDRKWFFMTNVTSILFLFYKSQTVNRLKEIIQHPTDESFLRLCNKDILTEIYRDMQTSDFQVIQECSSLAFRNGAVQMYFLTPARSMFARKYVKPGFWLCYGRILFTILNELKFVKRVKFLNKAVL